MFSSERTKSSYGVRTGLNIQDCLEKSLKIKFVLKSTGKTLKGLEKSLNLPFTGVFNTVFEDLNQYKIVVHQIKAPQFYKYFLKLIFYVKQSNISEVVFKNVNQYFA